MLSRLLLPAAAAAFVLQLGLPGLVAAGANPAEEARSNPTVAPMPLITKAQEKMCAGEMAASKAP